MAVLNCMRLLMLILLFLGSTAYGASDKAGLSCVQRMLDRYSSLSGYSALMRKIEYDLGDSNAKEELVELTVRKPDYVRMVYLTEGATGIRNNGMAVEYRGQPDLRVQLGKARGLGFLVNLPASLAVGNTVDISDPKVIEGEYFTINRAGFGHIAKLLAHHLEALKGTSKGGIRQTEAGCSLRYDSHNEMFRSHRLGVKESIFDIEDRFGVLAYHLYHENRDRFDSFYDLFHRKRDVVIRIPEFFFDFEMRLDPATDLPSVFRFFMDGKKAAEYLFSEVKTVE